MDDWTKNEMKAREYRERQQRERDQRVERWNARHLPKRDPNRIPLLNILGKWDAILNYSFMIFIFVIIASVFFDYIPLSNGIGLLLVLVVVYTVVYIVADGIMRTR